MKTRFFTALLGVSLFLMGCEPDWGESPDSPSKPLPTPDVEAPAIQFEKKACISLVVSADCQYCHDCKSTIKNIINESFDGKVHMMTFFGELRPDGHNDLCIAGHMPAVEFYPTIYIDYDASRFNIESFNNLNDYMMSEIQNSLNEIPSCGIAISSDISEGKITAKVRLTASETGSFNLVICTVENDVEYYQRTKESEIIAEHPYVVRHLEWDNYLGKTYMLTRGQEIEVTYECPVRDDWNTDGLYIYALALKDGLTDNINACLASGSADYVITEQTSI